MTTVGPRPGARTDRTSAPLGPAHASVRIDEARNRIAEQLVGRTHELELVLAAVSSGRDLVLEGPPGTSKTTILKAITAEWGIDLHFVEGNADLTPSKLVGHHNPARVLKEDYSADNFVDGPLVQAMRDGGFLYIEEFNRAPEDTVNTLLTAMADREISIPRVGVVSARPTFRVIASMNPFDNIGTTRLSTSVHDRMCRLAIGYQPEDAERDVVALRTGARDRRQVADCVAVTRATREHADLRQGSSVRGAIDLLFVLDSLLAMRAHSSSEETYRTAFFDAMTVALSGRIHVDEAAETTPERVLREIWEDHFILDPAEAEPG
ncbi:AAA family ATPase [Nocardioides sp.]|uniref:AAA family ATPase n=1 Tax=Nocardioides sp. TaxID=35761 RepID=UPI003D150FF5